MQEIRAAEAAARAAESRKRAEAEKRAAEAAASAAAALGVKQRAEMDARADHLRKQRDLILAQRKKQREAEAAKFAAPAAPAPLNVPAPTVGMRRAAGYDASKVDEPLDYRAQLSRALGSGVKASLAGGEAAQAERLADLEATKAALRAEAERARM